jgi:cytochrome c oxidase subunit 2
MTKASRRSGRFSTGDTVRAARPPSRRHVHPGDATDVRKRLSWVLGLVVLGLLLASCAPHATQDTLKPQGSNARTIKDLFVPVFWVAVAVFVIVEGGIVWILIRFRHRRDAPARMPPQLHGNTRLEVGWTILPAVVLAFVMVPTVATIWDLAKPPPAGALNVTVEGFQWWWGFVYTDDDMKTTYGDKGPITVADVLVIPAGRPVYLSLESKGGGASDFQVIHSFWIPELAGKQDVVPNRTNHIPLEADHPGTYTGQCAEFCGLEHGRMKFRVQALSRSDWEAWVANQKQPSVTPTDQLASAGMDLFLKGSCIACHAIGGTTAGATAAPNLTHFAAPEHQCFAGCNWDTTDRAALEAWLHDPNAVKLGAKMPNYHLQPDEIDALVAYLESLT